MRYFFNSNWDRVDHAVAYGKRIKLRRLQNLLVADVFPNVGTGIAVLCSTRRSFLRLPRAMTVPPAPVSTSKEALTRLTSTSMTRRFGSLSKFACLRITTPKPSRFKKMFSAVGVVAVFLSESFETVINGDVGNGVGVTGGSCATGLVLGGSTADGANACAAGICSPATIQMNAANATSVIIFSFLFIDSSLSAEIDDKLPSNSS